MKKTLFLLCLSYAMIISSCDKEKTESILSKPEANFSIDFPIAKRGDTIHFANNSENAENYLWDFGDGNNSSERNPTHIFNNSGNYSIILNAIKGSDTSSYSCEIFIKDLTVMTYNIAIGGGAIQQVLEIAKDNGHTQYLTNRMPEILSIIRNVNPDILGLQEALLWDSFEPAFYKSFADSLGMEYYHYLEYEEAEWNGICIYSKFPIESTDFILHQPCVPDQVWNGTCMVKAVVNLDTERKLDVLVCHLMFHVAGAQTCEVEAIHNSLKNDFNPYTVLMGDMNYTHAEGQYYSQLFSDAGLYYLNSEEKIDHIWASKELAEISLVNNNLVSDHFPNISIYQLLRTASDHSPVTAHFGFK